MYLQGLAERTLAAMRSLNEALSAAAAPAPPPPGPAAPGAAPTPPSLSPPAAASPAGLAVAPPGASQGAVPQAINPLSMLSDFRSPPLAAALQGPQGMQGHPALNRPTGL